MNYPKKERLSAQEEVFLLRKIQLEGDEVARNRLVMAHVGLVYFVVNQMLRSDLCYEDLLQAGLLGLLRATETFDLGRKNRFSTYGVFWIRAKIKQIVLEQSRLSKHQVLGFSIDLLGDDVHHNPEEQLLRTEQEQLVQNSLWKQIQELKNPKLSLLIQHRLLAEEPESLEKIAKRLNLSRETCRLLELKMLKNMRNQLANW